MKRNDIMEKALFITATTTSVFICGTILCGIGFLVGMLILFLGGAGIFSADAFERENALVCILLGGSFSLFFIGLILMFAIKRYVQKDVFFEDRFCRIRGKRIIFTIEYANIASYEIVYDFVVPILLIKCKNRFAAKGWYRGAKQFSGYWSKLAIRNIRQIIEDYRYSGHIK